MNPYSRFGLVSNTVSAAILVGGLALFGLPVIEAISEAAGGSGPAVWGALAAGVSVLVVFWLAMTEAIFPTLFRFNSVRRLVLGKYYVEGTWLQSEKGDDLQRMSVIDIQPDGKNFIFSGYALNADLEIEANSLIEFSKFEWPFVTYKYRNSLSDGADGRREGVGEIQFEMNRDAARRYNGYLQYIRGSGRLRIEGAKLTSNRDVKQLRSLEGRQTIFGKYWELFFERTLRKAEAPVHAKPNAVEPVVEEVAVGPELVAEVPMEDEAPVVVERRKKTSAAKASSEGVVPRRRASDWKKEPRKAKPKLSDQPKVEDVFEDFDDFREDAPETGTGGKSSGASDFRSRRRRR